MFSTSTIFILNLSLLTLGILGSAVLIFLLVTRSTRISALPTILFASISIMCWETSLALANFFEFFAIYNIPALFGFTTFALLAALPCSIPAHKCSELQLPLIISGIVFGILALIPGLIYAPVIIGPDGIPYFELGIIGVPAYILAAFYLILPIVLYYRRLLSKQTDITRSILLVLFYGQVAYSSIALFTLIILPLLFSYMHSLIPGTLITLPIVLVSFYIVLIMEKLNTKNERSGDAR